MSIATLVNQIKNRDEVAFEKIYDKLHKILFYDIHHIFSQMLPHLYF